MDDLWPGLHRPQLLVSVLLLGIADSMIGPYLVLFGADEAQLSPLQVGVFISVIAVSGLAVSAWLGRRYDRSASRAPAFLGRRHGSVPAVVHVGPYASRPVGRRFRPAGTPALRLVWSLAWAIGPMIGAAVLAWQGYRGLMVLTAVVLRWSPCRCCCSVRPRPRPRGAAAGDAGTRLTRPMLPVAASFTLFHTAMLSGAVALPIYLTRTLDRPDRDVGLLFSVCALVEIPAALSVALLPARVRKRWVILLGMALFVAYFLLVAASSSMPLLIGTQVARGVALAVVGALGITYVQDLLPRATGRATALFANTFATGSLISASSPAPRPKLSATGRRCCCAASSAPSGACCWPALGSRAAPPTPTWNPRRVRPRPGAEPMAAEAYAHALSASLDHAALGQDSSAEHE